MNKIKFILIGFACLISACSGGSESFATYTTIDTKPTELINHPGFFVQDFRLHTGKYSSHVFTIITDKSGKLISGTDSQYRSGKTTAQVTTIIIKEPNSQETKTIECGQIDECQTKLLKLKEISQREYQEYLRLKEKFEIIPK